MKLGKAWGTAASLRAVGNLVTVSLYIKFWGSHGQPQDSSPQVARPPGRRWGWARLGMGAAWGGGGTR